MFFLYCVTSHLSDIIYIQYTDINVQKNVHTRRENKEIYEVFKMDNSKVSFKLMDFSINKYI